MDFLQSSIDENIKIKKKIIFLKKEINLSIEKIYNCLEKKIKF